MKKRARSHCSSCGTVYGPDTPKSAARSLCRACDKVYQRFKRYGITPKQYVDLLESQNNSCAICGIMPSVVINLGRALCVDHDSETGRVRGLLCVSCNTGIGQLKHSEELLNKAVVYLRST